MPSSSNWFFPFKFSYRNISHLSHACYMPHTPHQP
jgi:hypothetical protein